MTTFYEENSKRFYTEIKKYEAQGFDLETPFTNEEFARIMKEFSIDADMVFVSRKILNIAVLDTVAEARFKTIDRPSAQRKIKSIEKLSSRLIEELRHLNNDCLILFDHAHKAQEAMLSCGLDEDKTEPPSEVVLNSVDLIDGTCSEIKGTIALAIPPVREIHELATLALRVSGGGKRGRPSDERLDQLLHAAYQIFTKIIGKEFTLDWERNEIPASPAARFCTDVVKLSGSTAPASLIISTSRNVKNHIEKQ